VETKNEDIISLSVKIVIVIDKSVIFILNAKVVKLLFILAGNSNYIKFQLSSHLMSFI
jgi:hypothetical protein